MLKIFNKTVQSLNYENTKCAEVFYQGSKNFTIICTLCEMKSFEFGEYLAHFDNEHLHLDNTNSKSDHCQSKHSEGNESQSMEIQNISNKSPPATDGTFRSSLNMYSKCDDIEESFSEDEDYKFEKQPIKQESTSNTVAYDLNNYSCHECKKTYKYQQTLDQHMQTHHTLTHKCPRCDKVFPKLRSYDSHVQEAHGGFPCDGCEKSFKLKESLVNHRLIHKGVKTFICQQENCGKSFYDRKQLSNHRRMVHSTERNAICEICGYATKTKSNLVVHMRYHTGEKPYACKQCGKGFATQSLLSDHMPMHSDLKPHKCDTCGAAFSRPKALYHHKFLHLGIKKFVCKVCGNAYAQAAGLSGHMRKHKAEFP